MLLTCQGLVSQGQALPLLLSPGMPVLKVGGQALALKQSGLQGLLLHSGAGRVEKFELHLHLEVRRIVKANDPSEGSFPKETYESLC